jgi:hypothetical protein
MGEAHGTAWSHFVSDCRDILPGIIGSGQCRRPVRTVPLFAVTASELAPLQALKGDKTTDAQRRIAAAGLETVGDVIARYYVTYNFVDTGLRGGSFTYAATDTGYKFTLKGLKWTSDVAVSGTVAWDHEPASNIIAAQVTLESAGKQVGTLQIRWNDGDINAMTSVTGTIQGATLVAERIAP